MPTCSPVGPWRPVELIAAGCAPVTVRNRRVALDGRVGVVELAASIDGVDVDAAWLEVGGQRAPLTLHDGEWRGRVEVSDVEQWFPATHGRPTRYSADVVTLGSDGERRHPIGQVGFRRVDVDQSDGGWSLSINGLPVFCRGVVWAPVDPVGLCADRTAIRTDLLALADAGCNLLRIPGFGVYADDEFLDTCDELGLMVWHDAMFANMDHPIDDADFRESVELELEQFLRRCQGHPSVVTVCGGSEVEQQASMMGVPEREGTNRVGREILMPMAARLLPEVPVAPCSPFGGVFPFTPNEGVCHYYGVGAYLRPLSDARTSNVRFTTECLAFANVPCRQSIDHLLGDGDRPGHSPAWKRRVPRDRSAGWDFEDVRDHYVRELFGVDPVAIRYSDPDRYLDLGRAAVSAVIQSTLTEFRRPTSTCNGALVFHHRDPWAAAGWGMLDWQGRPKSAFHALARACRPRTVLLTGDGLNGVVAIVTNDAPDVLDEPLRVRLFDVHGQLIATESQRLRIDPGTSQELSVDRMFGQFRDLSAAYRFGPAQVDVIDATLGDPAAPHSVTNHLLPQGHDRPRVANLEVSGEAVVDGDEVVIRISADGFAHFVSVDIDGVVPNDNWFHLSPGDQRELRCRVAGSSLPRSGEVRALNGYGSRAILLNGAST
jgi:beta-mannosidase